MGTSADLETNSIRNTAIFIMRRSSTSRQPACPVLDWETCMTMNTTWGYSDPRPQNGNPAATLIRNLIDIASKGGNYLLNIGPKGDGSVPAESAEAMKAIGEWMKVNGEAIYAYHGRSPFERLDWGPLHSEEAGKRRDAALSSRIRLAQRWQTGGSGGVGFGCAERNSWPGAKRWPCRPATGKPPLSWGTKRRTRSPLSSKAGLSTVRPKVLKP